jgi:peptide/nickel transport system substrate-binding protein
MALPNLPVVNFSGTWLTKGPTSDIRVRQAMSYSINRQELADTMFKGFAKPGGAWFMNESTYGWDPSWKPDAYDVAKAKQLLAAAGYPGKFQDPVIKFYSTVQGTNSWLPDMAQALAGYWQAVGIQVKIEPIDSAKLSSMYFVRGSEGIIGTVWPYVSASVPNNIYHSRNMYTSGGVHTTGNDPKEDELFNKMLTEIDPKKAVQAFRDFQNYGHDMYVTIGTVEQFDQMALSPQVGKFSDGLHLGLYFALAGIQHK